EPCMTWHLAAEVLRSRPGRHLGQVQWAHQKPSLVAALKQLFELASHELPERVDKALVRLLPDVSRATVQRWISEGRVKVDGKICRPKQQVRGGSKLEVEPSEPPPSTALPDPDVQLQVLYE